MEADGCANCLGPCRGCAGGCGDYWCCCKGCKALYCDHKAQDQTMQLGNDKDAYDDDMLSQVGSKPKRAPDPWARVTQVGPKPKRVPDPPVRRSASVVGKVAWRARRWSAEAPSLSTRSPHTDPDP